MTNRLSWNMLLSIKALREANQAGFKANHTGYAMDSNPYDKDCERDCFESWIRGWRASERDFWPARD